MKLGPTKHLGGEFGSTWTWGPIAWLHMTRYHWFSRDPYRRLTVSFRWRAWLAEAFNFHSSKRGFSWNEGGMRGFVLVVYWAGPFAPFIDFAMRLPYRWIGFGWSDGFYTRGHKTGTWRFI